MIRKARVPLLSGRPARCAGFIAIMLLVAPAYAVDPPRGVQFSADGTLAFVNKDVDGQRFAITREADDTVTGNVFFEDCRRPKFIVCSPAVTDNEFSCAVAPACEATPCGFGDAFITDVTLPADFFQVPTDAPDDEEDPSGEGEPCPTTTRALQISDDGARIFVNKDVDGQRYAIAQFTADRTITGNVFVGPDVPPKFIICDPLGEPDEHRWLCDVSDSCPAPPAECTFGGFSAEVTLPADFFVLNVEATQTTNAFGTTGAVTSAIRVGVASIPTGAAAGQADGAQVVLVDAQSEECPGGGTVQMNGDAIEYDDCRVGSLVCSGTGSASGGTFSAELSCLDLDRDRAFDLFVDLELVSTSQGGAMIGVVDAELSGGAGFALEFDELSISESAAGGGAFGTTFVGNVRTYFPGVFSDFSYPFDGSETVIISAFIPSAPAFITKNFELNLVSGELTPLD